MLISIVRHGPKAVGVTVGAVSKIVSVDTTTDDIALFDDFGMLSLEIRNEDGLYAADIRSSGALRLAQVEDPDGSLIHA